MRLYIDAFAGTGRCDVKINGEKQTIDGSARIALDTAPPFNEFYFIETKKKNIAPLNNLCAQYPHKKIKIIQEDANTALKTLCSQRNWKSDRAVLFLDPFGMQVEWSTLKTIASTQAIDVWYLFPYAGSFRQAPWNADALAAGKVVALNRLYGTDEWRSMFYAPNPQADLFVQGNNDVRTAEHWQMLAYMSSRLKELFPSVTKPKVLYNDRNAPLFALYFAVSNPASVAQKLAMRIADHILGHKHIPDTL
jgi:three-Cys-motif partner protein